MTESIHERAAKALMSLNLSGNPHHWEVSEELAGIVKSLVAERDAALEMCEELAHGCRIGLNLAAYIQENCNVMFIGDAVKTLEAALARFKSQEKPE